MSWELVKDSKQCKCWLDLDEVEVYTDERYRVCRNWKTSIGKKIGIRYKWMNDEVEEKWFFIKDYINRYLILVDENNNNNKFEITRGHLCEGKLGKIFNKHTKDFKYNIGKEINDIVIIDREYRKDTNNCNRKYYKYQCKCGNIDWIYEGSLKDGVGCNVCCHSPQKVLKGVNDISTTNPELCKYFINQEDIYIHTANSGERVLLKCPDCDFQKEMKIGTLYRQGFGCPKCGDGKSYPEKFMANVLTQLNIRFITELNRTTFDWCQNFRYDFYLPDYNIILETHGGQHYEDEEVHQNDMIKYDIVVLNGFEANRNYYVIDSRHSTLEWMKKNIIKKLGHLFDFSNVDWEMADRESQKSHMKLACKLKKENPDLTTKEIVKLIKEETGIEYTMATITRWLNRGNDLGLCYYDGKEEVSTANKTRKGKNNPCATLVDRFDKQGNLIDTKYNFEYVAMGFNAGAISSCCKGKHKTHKDFIFKYHEEVE